MEILRQTALCRLETLHGRKVNIVTMVNSTPAEAEDSEPEDETVEVKTVKYRELIQQAERREDDSRDVR